MNTRTSVPWPSMIQFDNLPCLVWYADNPKCARQLNRAWGDTCQREQVGELTKNWDSCVHPLDRVRRTITLQRAFATHQPYQLEYRLKTGYRNYIWVSEQAKPIFDLDDTFAGMVGICIDITQHKKHESALAQLGTIIESSDDAIYSLDLDGKLLTWNQGAEELYGYTRKELVGSNIIKKIIPKGKIGEFINSANRIVRGENIEALETQRRRKNGEVFEASLSYSPLRDPDGDIIGISVIARDVSQQKQGQRELITLLDRLENLIKHAPIGIAFLDKDLRYIAINEYLAAIDGFTIDEHLGRTPKEVLPPTMAKQVISKLKEVITARTAQTFELEGHTYVNPHFNRWWLITFYPIKENENELGLGAIMQDITEQKILEKRKDDFISMASHELKTPVTSIKAFTQLLDRTKPTRHQEEYLSKIGNQTNRLIHIINEMLDVSKIRTGRFSITKEMFDFDELVEEIINNFSPTHSSHTIEIHGTSHHKVNADRNRISQVILNLISNAVKFSPDADRVDVFIAKAGDSIRFSVTDYGIGVSKANQSRIFQTFYRVVDIPDGEFPGLGIGLSIASQIIKLHGGTIGVKSTEGKGSTFYFTLPTNLNI